MKDVAACGSVLAGGGEPCEGQQEPVPAWANEAHPAEGAVAARPAPCLPGTDPAATAEAHGAPPGAGEALPRPASGHSGQPRQFVLRQGALGAAELEVDFSSPVLSAALRVAAGPLLSGPWQALVRLAGAAQAAAGPWNEVCRHRDAKCEYVELEQPLEGDWRLTRQMLLARRDQFLLLADAVVGPPSVRTAIEYELRWPLASGVACAWAKESWEGWIVRGRQRQASVLPLGLPEWRAAWEDGALEAAEGTLRLRQAAHGSALYAPLWLDLARGRLRRALTWRRLTVGENLAVVPPEEAVGYRVQVGREQWLIYHSLAPVGNRSVLGLNTCAAFVCGRFLPSGKIEEIVVIE